MPVRIVYKDTEKRKTHLLIVAADSRAKRDGRYLEKLGIYNPNTLPASVELNLDRAMDCFKKVRNHLTLLAICYLNKVQCSKPPING